MKTRFLLLCGALVAPFSPVWADEDDHHHAPSPAAPSSAAPVVVSPALEANEASQVTKTVFLRGLKEPQGLALCGSDLLVADYQAGEILKFGLDGTKKATLASGLKNPSQIVVLPRLVSSAPVLELAYDVFVSERKANRIIQVQPDGTVQPVGQPVVEALGLTHLHGMLYAIAHTTSKIYRIPTGVGSINRASELIYEAPVPTGKQRRYGLRCLAADGGSLLLSDEVGNEVLLVSPNGRVATWAGGIEDPSGMEVRGDYVYVCDEANGGQLWKLDKRGEKTLVANELGRPRNILFLNDNTALVSDRNGTVWKLAMP